MNEQKQATRAEELRRQFMDHSTPLTETGHWARRHIERLEDENERLSEALEKIVVEWDDYTPGTHFARLKAVLDKLKGC